MAIFEAIKRRKELTVFRISGTEEFDIEPRRRGLARDHDPSPTMALESRPSPNRKRSQYALAAY
jgi:hypothetical protein